MSTQQSPSFKQIKELNDQFDQQLKEFDKKHVSESFSLWKRILFKIFLSLIGLVLPFFLLVRTSVLIYQNYQTNGWLALLAGCLATVVLLLAYGGIFIYKFGMGQRAFTYIFRGIVVLVIAYTFYGVLYYSSLNTKTEEIHSYYQSLHPIMRVALTTVTLADSDIMVTGIQRHPEDYHQLGLTKNDDSLHYLQSTGYVHAVDLRTKSRPTWKNWLFENSFKLLGLSTMRHVGTADHLHVYLPPNT